MEELLLTLLLMCLVAGGVASACTLRTRRRSLGLRRTQRTTRHTAASVTAPATTDMTRAANSSSSSMAPSSTPLGVDVSR